MLHKDKMLLNARLIHSREDIPAPNEFCLVSDNGDTFMIAVFAGYKVQFDHKPMATTYLVRYDSKDLPGVYEYKYLCKLVDFNCMPKVPVQHDDGSVTIETVYGSTAPDNFITLNGTTVKRDAVTAVNAEPDLPNRMREEGV